MQTKRNSPVKVACARAQATVLATWLALASFIVHGQNIPPLINYQGRLTDASSAPLPPGTYSVAYRLWNKQSLDVGQQLIWGREYDVTIVEGGAFNVILGAAGGRALADNPPPAINDLTFAFGDSNRFFGLMITRDAAGQLVGNPKELVPRQQILSVPFAMLAQNLAQGAIKQAQVDAVFLADILQPPGAITAFGGNSVPAGWLLCDGRSASSQQFPRLFAAISTNWGAGIPGTTNDFNQPDLRGVFLRGMMAITNVVGSGTIASSNATFLNHGFQHSGVQVQLASGILSGLVTNVDYWTIYVDNNTLAFATNFPNALAGTKLPISGANSAIIKQWVDPDNALRDVSIAGGGKKPIVGSLQLDDFKSHTHRYWRTQGGTSSGSNPNNIAGNYANTDPSGGNETRPKNVYVNYIIKY